MITYYYKKTRTSTIALSDHFQTGSWVYVENPTNDELAMLIKQFDLDVGHVHDVMDDDEIPRLEREGDVTYLFARHAHDHSSHEVITRPVLFVIGTNYFMTISRIPLARLERFTSGAIHFATSHQLGLLTQIMDQIIDQYEEYINSSSRQIQQIRKRLQTHEVNNQDFVDFVLIEDRLNSFLSAMLPTTAIMKRVLLGRHVSLTKDDEESIEDVMLNNDQLVESCRSNIKSLISIREAYSTIAGNNLSRTMKVLTIATMLIALPNMFFGMYGMNISLPFQQEVWAYIFVMILTVTSIVVVTILARSRKIF
ncbi:magnesium transporter CorA family protein [Candidatus Saccharibacteria bacterium]|nr:magnesium transporter CorA family protein [Candidatus Saccharibacteria bacterium]